MRIMFILLFVSTLALLFCAEKQAAEAPPKLFSLKANHQEDLTFYQVLNLFDEDLLSEREMDFLRKGPANQVEEKLWIFAEKCRADHCVRARYFLLMGKFFEERKGDLDRASTFYSLSYFYLFKPCTDIFPEIESGELLAVFKQNSEADRQYYKKVCNEIRLASDREQFKLSPLIEACLFSESQCPQALRRVEQHLGNADDLLVIEALRYLQDAIKKKKTLPKENIETIDSTEDDFPSSSSSNSSRSRSRSPERISDNIVPIEAEDLSTNLDAESNHTSIDKPLRNQLEDKQEYIRQMLLKEKERYQQTHHSVKRLFDSHAYAHNLSATDYEVFASRYDHQNMGIRIEARFFLKESSIELLDRFIKTYQKTIQKFEDRKQQSFREFSSKFKIMIPEEFFDLKEGLLQDLSFLGASNTQVVRLTGENSLFLILKSPRFLEADWKSWKRIEKEMITEMRILRNQLRELN